MVSGKRSGARGFDFFSVVVDLTEEGIKHVDDIVTLTFQYINMLKKKGPIEWIYNVIDEMKYNLSSKCLANRNTTCKELFIKGTI